MTRVTKKPGQALASAKIAWGDALPEWVETLAIEVDTTSTAKAAKVIGYSAAVPSLVVNNKYNGDLAGVEAAVRGALLNKTVNCPVDGEITSDKCGINQRSRLNTTAPRTIRLYQNCRGSGNVPKCPHSRIGG